MLTLRLLAAVACLSGSRGGGAFEPLLFLDLNDTADPSGLIWPVANAVGANASYSPPPLPYELGSLVIATIASQAQAGLFEVYAENTTGWEPLSASERAQGHHECALLRYTTRDFVRYSPPHIALTIPTCSGTPTMKSIARSTESMYAMFTVGGGDGASSTYTSHDAGMSWTRGATSGVAKPDKDDLNLIYNQGRFVDMQIVWQNFSLPYAILIQAARAPPADDSIATRPLRSGAPAADQPTSNCCIIIVSWCWLLGL